MTKAEFKRRRAQLMRMMGKNAIAIVPTSPERVRNRDVHYPFRPDSDFYYLTGFAEPDAVAVIVPGRPNGEFLIFCRERDAEKERWDGQRMGTDGVLEHYHADDAFPIDDIDDILPGIMESCERVYYTMGLYKDFDVRIADWVNSLRSGTSRGLQTPHEFVALDHLLHDMRLYKSRAEIKLMRQAANIAARAHKRAMSYLRYGLTQGEGFIVITGGIGTGKTMLVYAERHEDIEAAIAREKLVKKWRREWNFALIEKDNPDWRDLWEEWFGGE